MLTALLLSTLLAQGIAGYSLIQWLIFLVVIIGILGIVFIVLRESKIPVPAWVWSILGIVLLIVVAILAIKFLAGMA